MNGTAQYGIDVRLPGMLIATVAASPVLGGKVVGVDDQKAKAVPGVRQVVRLDDAVAVVADHMWAAKQGLAALDIRWDDGPNAKLSTADVVQGLANASETAGVTARKDGRPGERARRVGEEGRSGLRVAVPRARHDGTDELHGPRAEGRLRGVDRLAGIEPRAGHGGRGYRAPAREGRGPQPSSRWRLRPPARGGLRDPSRAHRQAGGCAGQGRVDPRGGRPARRLSPVLLRPARSRPRSGGRPVAWTHRIVGPAIIARYLPHFFKDGKDVDAIDGAVQLLYDIPAIQVEHVRHEEPVLNTGFWRGVGVTHNNFVIESFIDELASASTQDPVAFRRAMLGKSPRALAVLDLAAKEGRWGKPLPRGRGRGIALLYSGWGSYLAQVAEVEVTGSGDIRVHRIVCAVDCGQIVNPEIVKAQIESGVVYGISAALWGEVTLKDGRVEQSNFHNYRVLRMNEAPPIEVHLVRNDEAPGGIGEPGTAVTAAALNNAIYAATGKRLRKAAAAAGTYAANAVIASLGTFRSAHNWREASVRHRGGAADTMSNEITVIR